MNVTVAWKTAPVTACRLSCGRDGGSGGGGGSDGGEAGSHPHVPALTRQKASTVIPCLHAMQAAVHSPQHCGDGGGGGDGDGNDGGVGAGSHPHVPALTRQNSSTVTPCLQAMQAAVQAEQHSDPRTKSRQSTTMTTSMAWIAPVPGAPSDSYLSNEWWAVDPKTGKSARNVHIRSILLVHPTTT